MRLAMEGDNGLLQVYAEDSVTSGKTKAKDKINILHDNVLDDRG